MDTKINLPASPGTPLFAVSPERANRQPFPQPVSLPSELANLRDPFATAHSRTSSDVQGKVAQFNSLSKEAIQRRKDNEAALKRAVMGREEAENETRRLKEENRILRKEIEEGRGRERKMAERIEGVVVGDSESHADRMDNAYSCDRSSYNNVTRCTLAHKLCMTKKLDGQEKRRSSHQVSWSNYSKN